MTDALKQIPQIYISSSSNNDNNNNNEKRRGENPAPDLGTMVECYHLEHEFFCELPRNCK
jgi:hypothetical protein